MEEDSEFTNVHLKNAINYVKEHAPKARQMKMVTQQILKVGQPVTMPVAMLSLDQKGIVSSFNELEPARQITNFKHSNPNVAHPNYSTGQTFKPNNTRNGR